MATVVSIKRPITFGNTKTNVDSEGWNQSLANFAVKPAVADMLNISSRLQTMNVGKR